MQSINSSPRINLGGIFRKPNMPDVSQEGIDRNSKSDINSITSVKKEPLRNMGGASGTGSLQPIWSTIAKSNNKEDNNNDKTRTSPSPHISAGFPQGTVQSFGHHQGPQTFRPIWRVQDRQGDQDKQQVIPHARLTGSADQPPDDLTKQSFSDAKASPFFGGFGSITSATATIDRDVAVNQGSLADQKQVQPSREAAREHHRQWHLPVGLNPSPSFTSHHARDPTEPLYLNKITPDDLRQEHDSVSTRPDQQHHKSFAPPLEPKAYIDRSSMPIAPSRLRNSITLSPSPSSVHSRDDGSRHQTATPHDPSSYSYSYDAPHQSDISLNLVKYPRGYTTSRDSVAADVHAAHENTAHVTQKEMERPVSFNIPRSFQKPHRIVNQLDLNTIMGTQDDSAKGYSTRSWEDVKKVIAEQNLANEGIMEKFDEIKKKLEGLAKIKDQTLVKKRTKTERYNEAGIDLQESTMGLQHKTTSMMATGKRRRIDPRGKSSPERLVVGNSAKQ